MKKVALFLFSGLFSLSLIASEPKLPFNKVIIWGHKLHSHTHSYIHYAFHKTFKYLGYDTYWFDNNDDVRNFDFHNSLFITESQVDSKMPHRRDCRYILHNCDLKKYTDVMEQNNAIVLQVYTHDCLSRNVVEIDDYTFIDVGDKCIYMPWATDLLPYEIDAIKKQIPTVQKEKVVYFVGSYMEGGFANKGQYDAFAQACQGLGVTLRQVRGVSAEENIVLIQKSYMAPALQGKWQCDVGYIPCRIFKNISYGQPGMTNSKTVYNLFKGKILYNSDPAQLFHDAQAYLQKMTIQELYAQMDFVKERHTYLNRINHLLNFLHLIKPIPGYEPNTTTIAAK
jgi:hypothetical protein